MTDWTLRELTDLSWILLKDGTNHGLVIATASGLKAIGPMEKKLFDTADSLSAYLGGRLSFEAREREDDSGDEIGNIDGYPIKHGTAHDVIQDNIITYSKTSRGKSRYAAGYFAIEFDHGWTASYCPRHQTLLANNHIGPFRTKLEMLNAMAQKKRQNKQ